jgi:hypothetical protein
MEDISKELEQEIARSKPKPYISNKNTTLLIIDDSGKIKSGDYLKILVKFLLIITVICFGTAAVFCYLYADSFKDRNSIKAKLDIAQGKVIKLNKEKEVLMAKIVISGAKLDIESKPVVVTGEKKDIKNNIKNREEKSVFTELENVEKKEEFAGVERQEDGEKIDETFIDKPGRIINKTVTIENFVVKESRSTQDLLVRFDLRKISGRPGDVSGRIFTILKPEQSSQDQWLVIPSAKLKKGIPFEYKKGQYFSIVNFKPVKFRIKNQGNPDFFKKASIFVFNEQKDLIFQKLVNITDVQ